MTCSTDDVAIEKAAVFRCSPHCIQGALGGCSPGTECYANNNNIHMLVPFAANQLPSAAMYANRKDNSISPVCLCLRVSTEEAEREYLFGQELTVDCSS